MLGPSIAASESLRAWGSRYARLVFERCGRNKRAAARYLDISYHTLQAYLGYGYTEAPAAGSRTPGWARLHGGNHAGPATLVKEAAVKEAAHLRHDHRLRFAGKFITIPGRVV